MYNVWFSVKHELLSKTLASIENMADWLCNKKKSFFFNVFRHSNEICTTNDYATAKEIYTFSFYSFQCLKDVRQTAKVELHV